MQRSGAVDFRVFHGREMKIHPMSSPSPPGPHALLFGLKLSWELGL